MRTLAALFFACLISAPVLAKSKPVSIPFTTNSDGMVILPATVGGTISAHVIFDTGAGLDILAPSLIEKVHGKPAGQFTGFRMTGERLDIPLFIVPELSVGPMEKKNALVGSWDVLDKLHLDGIVSLNDFREQPVTFDFVNKVVIFETADSLAQRRGAETSVPVRFDDQRGITLDVFADFLIGDQPAQCEIDTGSPSATVSSRYMERLGIEKDGKGVRKIERRTVAGGMQTRYDTPLPQISLAAAPQISLAPAPASFSDIIYDCVVGLDFWSGRALTVDIPGRAILVSGGGRQ
jgi:Aspartyl protease